MNQQTKQAIQDAIDFLDGSYEAHKIRKSLQEALEQPAKEPVSKTAERDYNFMRDLAIGTEDILNEMLSAKPVATVAVDNFGNISVGWNKKPQHNDKLYTHPAQRNSDE